MNKEVDYKNTLNLPKTDMPMKANLAQREPEYLKFWHERDIYKKMEEASKNQNRYILHDGPPYANGHIHMGHVLNKVLKDIILKYKILRGYHCPFVPGWDCHGLPVEHQLFKELNLTKDEISQVDFRDKAKDYALRFVDIQKKEFQRLGVFADWDNAYLTLSDDYEAEILRSFAKIVEKGFVYKGRKPVNWCPYCQTALAEAEVEYAEHKSPSIYVKFKLIDESKNLLLNRPEFERLNKVKDKDFNFIIWTTTPWTLVSNIAVALSPTLAYRFIEVDGEVWILAEALVKDFKERVKLDKFQKIEIVADGNSFEELICEHPFINRKSYVVTADYVSSQEGTGCVHIAPGHGQEDYETWLINKHKFKDFDIIMPVDDRGRFDSSVEEFKGMEIDKANGVIIERLKNNKKLVWNEDIIHSYPHCWRCKKPIIFRATWQWFVDIEHNGLRDKLEKEIINKVKWIPQAARDRMLSMVKNRPDWCLSRQRYWGVPIPVFYCKKCNKDILNADIIYGLAEKVEKEGLDIWFEKEAKELLPEGFKCPNCSHNEFEKGSDILDVWFDSGISHRAVLKQREGLSYPADLYLEGSDQPRGWFQTSLITALIIEEKAPYKEVITHGFIVDESGKKMSKSLGNAISPSEVMKDLGADILRLWVASSDYYQDVSLSDTILSRLTEAYRKIRNTLRFMLGNLADFDLKNDGVNYDELFEIDKWALNKMAILYNECLKFYDSYQLHKVTFAIYNFCTVDMSSFYLDVLKDRLYTYGKNSLSRRSAQTVLYNLLTHLIKLIAPILSFTAEEVWQYISFENKEESVFLSRLNQDEIIRGWINNDIDNNWKQLLKVRDLTLKALELVRTKKIIGNSLEAEVSLFISDNKLFNLLKSYEDELPTIFIVSRTNIEKVSSLPEDSVQMEDLEAIGVKVKRVEAVKCPRCWRYVDTIGEDNQFKGICKRCAEAIKEMQPGKHL